jgi:hypothetical protein
VVVLVASRLLKRLFDSNAILYCHSVFLIQTGIYREEEEEEEEEEEVVHVGKQTANNQNKSTKHSNPTEPHPIDPMYQTKITITPTPRIQ